MDKSYLFSYKHDLTNYSELDHPQDKNKESRILAGYIIGVGTGGGEGRGLAPSFFCKVRHNYNHNFVVVVVAVACQDFCKSSPPPKKKFQFASDATVNIQDPIRGT